MTMIMFDLRACREVRSKTKCSSFHQNDISNASLAPCGGRHEGSMGTWELSRHPSSVRILLEFQGCRMIPKLLYDLLVLAGMQNISLSQIVEYFSSPGISR
jgi:hypothetical protein